MYNFTHLPSYLVKEANIAFVVLDVKDSFNEHHWDRYIQSTVLVVDLDGPTNRRSLLMKRRIDYKVLDESIVIDHDSKFTALLGVSNQDNLVRGIVQRVADKLGGMGMIDEFIDKYCFGGYLSNNESTKEAVLKLIREEGSIVGYVNVPRVFSGLLWTSLTLPKFESIIGDLDQNECHQLRKVLNYDINEAFAIVSDLRNPIVNIDSEFDGFIEDQFDCDILDEMTVIYPSDLKVYFEKHYDQSIYRFDKMAFIRNTIIDKQRLGIRISIEHNEGSCTQEEFVTIFFNIDRSYDCLGFVLAGYVSSHEVHDSSIDYAELVCYRLIDFLSRDRITKAINLASETSE